jgi:molybdate transport system substrate-binding protein
VTTAPGVRRVAGALLGVTVALVLADCGGGSSLAAAPALTAGFSGRDAALSGTVTVFAAASLQQSFTTIEKRFEAAHPGVTVTLGFGGSSALAQQIVRGAPVDVFASASPATMDQVIAAGGANHATTFARNVMAVAVPPGNPAGVTALADLARPGVTVALCQVQVPCGSVAATVLAHAEVAVTPVTQEADVASVLTKVQLGEVDAGIVYVTDVHAAGAKVKGIIIPDNINASTTYPIAPLTKAHNPVTARAFVAYVLSSAGSSVFTGLGFQKP